MRNLTQEAIELAEKTIIQMNPALADKQVREQLQSMQKAMIISQLEMLYEYYIEQFTQDIIHKYDNVV